MQMLAIVILALVVGGVIGYKAKERKTRAAVQRDAWVRRIWIRRSGWIDGIGNYSLESFDGGKVWYATERTGNGGVKIQGLAETRFPGLLKLLSAHERLDDYVRRNGPLTLTGPNAALEQVLLKTVGGTVEERGPENESQ